MRARRHLLLFFVAAGIVTIVDVANRSEDVITRVSFASAYAGMAFLAASLLIGPLRVLRGRRSPASTSFRRDVGIWAGILALLHVAFGLNAHLRGRLWEYFVLPAADGTLPRVRLDAFGAANYTGLMATAVIALLLALSNDLSLRKLGTRRWKALQRWNYGGFVLVVVHGVIYQALEDRAAGWAAVFGAMVLLTVGVQVVGFLRRRGAPRAGTGS